MAAGPAGRFLRRCIGRQLCNPGSGGVERHAGLCQGWARRQGGTNRNGTAPMALPKGRNYPAPTQRSAPFQRPRGLDWMRAATSSGLVRWLRLQIERGGWRPGCPLFGSARRDRKRMPTMRPWPEPDSNYCIRKVSKVCLTHL